MLYRAVALAAGFGGGELTAWGLRGDAIRARLQAVRGRLRRKVHSAQPLTEAEEEMQALLLREDGRWLADEQAAAAEVRASCREFFCPSAVRPAHRAREGSGAAAQRLVLGRLLGRGGFADVYATEWDGRPAAAKVIRHADAREGQRVRREVSSLRQLRHPRLVELLAYARLDCGSDGLQHVLILELMAGGTLHDYLKRAGGAAGSSRQLWTLLTDTATALAWLHGHATLHRDVKASNVLLDASHSRAKLGDFGLATTHYGELSQTPAVGTWRYLAPEASRHAGGGGRRSSMWHTPASDVYSFGLLLFEATYREPAFQLHRSGWCAHQAAVAGERPTPRWPRAAAGGGALGVLGECAAELMQRCWHREACRRPHAEEVLTALSSLAVPAGEPVPCDPVTCPGHVHDMSATCPAGEPVPCDSWLDAENGEGDEEGSALLGAAPGSGCSVGSSYHSDKVEGSYYTERIGASRDPQHEIEVDNLEIDNLEAEHVGEGEAEVGEAEVGGAAPGAPPPAILLANVL